MKVFKFGGASVKDAAGVKNILRVLRHTGFKDTLIVVSAMGKTTNALERVVHSFFENKEQFPQDLQKVREDHHRIIEELFESESAVISQKVNALFDGVLTFLDTTNAQEYSLVYDQVVSVGELVSTTIISALYGIRRVWKIIGWMPVSVSKRMPIFAMPIYTGRIPRRPFNRLSMEKAH